MSQIREKVDYAQLLNYQNERTGSPTLCRGFGQNYWLLYGPVVCDLRHPVCLYGPRPAKTTPRNRVVWPIFPDERGFSFFCGEMVLDMRLL